MKSYNSMYLGVCINNDDPEKRGRVQVFIPHIMPALYKNWNEEGKDINFTCVGDNIIDGLNSEITEKLKKILPWAEAASPIVGTSAPGNLMSGLMNAAAGIAGALIPPLGAAQAIAGAVSNYYDQSPTGFPPNTGDLNDLFSKAGKYNNRGVGFAQFSSSKGGGLCGVGTRSILGAMTGNSYFSNGLGGPAASLGWGGGSNYLTNSGYYNSATRLPPNYINDPSQWRVGDVVANTGGSAGNGHIQVWTGSAWVSDFNQGNRILTSASYGNYALHRAKGAIGGAGGSGGGGAAASGRTSVSGDSPSAPVHAKTTPDNLKDGAPPSQYGNPANQYHTGSGGSGLNLNTRPSQITIGSNGQVDQAALRSYLTSAISNSKLNGYKPADGAKYGVDGSVNSWVNHFMGLAKYESGFKTTTRNDADPGGSLGLFQVSVLDGSRYGANPSGKNWTEQQLFDPINNTNTAIAIYERNVLRDGSIAGSSGKGAGGYYASASMRKIAAAAASGELGSFDPNAPASAPSAAEAALGQQSTNMVNNTDNWGPSPSQNLNGVAKGLFSFPAVGAMLWTFFREGNPLFPVYFATSYSQAEWQSAYRYSSPGPGYNPVPKNGEPQSTGGIMNLNGVGGIRWENTNSQTDKTQDQRSIMLFGEDGSNVFFGNGYSQFLSKFDRRDQVEGDRWNTTLGFREDWVQGDSNSVVLGDLYVKVGNVSQTAVDAVERIQQIIKEIQAPLSEGGAGGGGGMSGSSTGGSAGSSSSGSSTQSAAAGKLTGSASENLKALQEGAAKTGGFYNMKTGKFQQTGFANPAPPSKLVTNASLAQVQPNAPAANRNQYVNIGAMVRQANLNKLDVKK